jgi:hypothetical protein
MPDKFILLFGLPRSGTTWAGKILDSHPSTLYRHEPDSVDRLTEVSLVPNASNQHYFSILRRYAQNVSANRHPKVVGKLPIFPKNYLSRPTLALYKAGVQVSKIFARLGMTLPVITAPLHCGRNGALVWKSIESLGRLGPLIAALPDAVGLHMVRHPCGFVASVQRGERARRFEDNRGASEDYGILELLLATSVGQRFGIDIGDLKAMQPEERLTCRWCIFNDTVLEDVASGSRVLTFAYETLCDSPLSTAHSLLQFAGLPWDKQVETFIAASTTSHDATYYSVFKNPQRTAYRWHKELSPIEIDRVSSLAERSITWRRLYGNDTLPKHQLQR